MAAATVTGPSVRGPEGPAVHGATAGKNQQHRNFCEYSRTCFKQPVKGDHNFGRLRQVAA